MAHHQLAFQLTHRLQSYTAHNDDGCTAQGDAHAAVVTAGLQGRNRRLTNQGVHDGEQGNYAKHQRTDQGQTGQNPHDVIGSGLAGTNAGNCAVVLTKIICHFNRVVLNGAVEIGKEDDQQEVHTTKCHSGRR